MKKAKKANKAIVKEEARIQRALLKLGYFAYTVQFQPCDGSLFPSLKLEARPAGRGDEDLILRT